MNYNCFFGTMLVFLLVLYTSANSIAQSVSKTDKNVKNSEDVVWEVSFEEDIAFWTFGNDSGTNQWTVSDTTPDYGFTVEDYENGSVIVSPLWYYMGYEYVNNYSNSGENFAWIDGISYLLGYGDLEEVNAWIQFDNIDLTDIDYPKLDFFQNYKKLNNAKSYIDFSIDGGVTWTELEINDDVNWDSYAVQKYEFLVFEYIANESNVSIRFRWQTNGSESDDYGYGWEIDDIKIVEAPAFDLKLNNIYVNFFNYSTYKDSDTRTTVFDNFHFRKIPYKQCIDDDSYLFISAIVENSGYEESVAELTVKITLPGGYTTFYEETIISSTLLPSETEYVEFTPVYYPEYLEAWMLQDYYGESVITVSVENITGVEENTSDNLKTTSFELTEKIYSSEYGNLTGQTGPQIWPNGHIDGEMLGVNYYFTYNTKIKKAIAFVGESTDENTVLIAHLYRKSYGIWTEIAVSAPHIVTENSIGNWVSFYFGNPVPVNGGSFGQNVIVAIECIYNGNNTIQIGYQPSINSGPGAAVWFMKEGAYANQFMPNYNWIKGGVGIRLEVLGCLETSFTANNKHGCEDLTVSFYGSSSYTGSWYWNFGDGSNSTLHNPIHTYTEPGNYSVSLYVSSPWGESDYYVYPNYITVYENPQFEYDVVHESFSGANDGEIGLNISGGLEPYSINWSTGDETETISYLSAGNYWVTVTDENGCSSSATITVESETGVKTETNNSKLVYPNPVNNLIWLNSRENNGIIKIYNTEGICCINTEWINQKPIDVSALASGIYSISLIINGNTITEQFIKE
jgi:PKD repeat protein